MNRLSIEKRALVLTVLMNDGSIRGTSRITGVSRKTIARLLEDAGKACQKYHDKHVRNISERRNIQCDELWSPIYAKDKMKDTAIPWDMAGSAWTFTAIDADTKLLVSYYITMNRDARGATWIMKDLKSRLNCIPNLAADKLEAYRIAVDRVYGKRTRKNRLRQSKGDGATAYVERHNATIRTFNKRYARKTLAFSKSIVPHKASFHLFAVYYNFCWIPRTLKITPAMAAGIDDKLRDMEWIVGLIDKNTPPPKKKPGPKVFQSATLV